MDDVVSRTGIWLRLYLNKMCIFLQSEAIDEVREAQEAGEPVGIAGDGRYDSPGIKF